MQLTKKCGMDGYGRILQFCKFAWTIFRTNFVTGGAEEKVETVDDT